MPVERAAELHGRLRPRGTDRAGLVLPAAPARARRDPGTLYPLDPDVLYVNVGFWSSVALEPGEPDGTHNRLIEDLVDSLGGRKSLYSTSFYEEDEFWRLYNGPAYGVLKKTYDPHGTAARPLRQVRGAGLGEGAQWHVADGGRGARAVGPCTAVAFRGIRRLGGRSGRRAGRASTSAARGRWRTWCSAPGELGLGPGVRQPASSSCMRPTTTPRWRCCRGRPIDADVGGAPAQVLRSLGLGGRCGWVEPPPQEVGAKRCLSGLTATPAAATRGHQPPLRRDQPLLRLVLGPSMAYTCAVYPTDGATLEQAQAEKFDLVARKLALQPGMRLLDVGCGWGGMVLHAAKRLRRARPSA